LFAKDDFADRTNGRAYASVASVRRFLSIIIYYYCKWQRAEATYMPK